MLRYVVASVVAAVVFILTLVVIGAFFGQIIADIPGQQAAIGIIAELAIPLAVSIVAFRSVVNGGGSGEND